MSTRARHRRRVQRMWRYANACDRLGATPGHRFIQRFVRVIWRRSLRRPGK